MVKVLLAGCHGLLGRNIAIRTSGKFNVLGIDIDEDSNVNADGFEYQKSDMTVSDEVKKIIENFKPNYIINTTGYNNVDNCEIHRKECWKNNVEIVQYLSRYGKRINSKLIHFSTDFIFDGKKGNYHEDERPNPVNYYGRSKLASENTVKASGIDFTIIRTSTLFDFDRNLKKENFATYVTNKLKEKIKIQIATDQKTNPTLASNLAEFAWILLKLEKTGVFHFVGSDAVTKYEFALKLAEKGKFEPDLIQPVLFKDLKRLAVRPENSSLCLDKVINEIGVKPLSLNESITHFFNKMEINK